MRLTISRPTPALVVALLALVMAMAGTGYAAISISGKSIKKRSVPANRVVPNTLGGRQIDETKLAPVPAALQALSADKAKTADSATSADSADSAQTALQARDSDHLEGKTASAFVPSKRILRIKLVYNVSSGSGAEATAVCGANEVALSGGGAWYVQGTDTTVGSGSTLATSVPLYGAGGEFDSWRAEGRNDAGVARDFRAWVVCARA
jgi:hypothetical protein